MISGSIQRTQPVEWKTVEKSKKVNISQMTYEDLKDDPQVEFESRGMIEANGNGEIEMYFVSLS